MAKVLELFQLACGWYPGPFDVNHRYDVNPRNSIWDHYDSNGYCSICYICSSFCHSSWCSTQKALFVAMELDAVNHDIPIRNHPHAFCPQM